MAVILCENIIGLAVIQTKWPHCNSVTLGLGHPAFPFWNAEWSFPVVFCLISRQQVCGMLIGTFYEIFTFTCVNHFKVARLAESPPSFFTPPHHCPLLTRRFLVLAMAQEHGEAREHLAVGFPLPWHFSHSMQVKWKHWSTSLKWAVNAFTFLLLLLRSICCSS